MAFFEIQHPDYNADKIETKIMESLKKRGIPLDQEQEFVEKYDLVAARREILSKPINRFKLMFFKMPRWMIQLGKRMPFYHALRRLLHIDL